MSLTRTTLAAALGATDTSATVAAAGTITAGYAVLIEGEQCVVTKAYVPASTTVPLLRGQGGTLPIAHPTTAGFVYGSPSDSEWGSAGAQGAAQFLQAGRSRKFQSITTATSTLTLPDPGSDLFVVLNGTSVITLTIPVPTKAMDGTILTIVGNGAAAHLLTFTGGLSGAGSSYDIITVNATAPIAFQAVACNSVWVGLCGIPIAGTVTNITGTVA